MFDMMKKAKALETVANEAKDILAVIVSVDANKNGIPDGVELLNELKELPALIQKEGSEVVEEAEEARKAIGDHFRKIASLAGESIEEIQEKASADIAQLRAAVEKLQ